MEYTISIWSWLGAISLLILAALYLYFYIIYSYWERKGIPAVKATWFLGSFGTRWNEPQGHIEKEWYTKHGKIFGIYEGMTPVLMVADPDLLKDIFVKDFNKLPNQKILNMGDKILDSMLINLEGKIWRRVRSAVTPIFSASKIKKMSYHIKKAVQSLEQNLKKATEKGEPVNCTSYFNAFTMDAISRCAFDIILDDHNSPNNPFVKSMENIFRTPLPWRTLLIAMFPRLCKLVNLSAVDTNVSFFFYNAVLELLKHRRSNPEEKHEDFLQFMLNCSNEEITENGHIKDNNGKEKRITQDEIIAQCVAFFMVGFVTTAATLGYTAYSLAVHSEFQEKLHQEIEEVLKDKEEINYEDLQNMKYLEAVISETLRYYTPVPRVDRWGEEDYVLGQTGIIVPKRILIGIPIYAIHHDPEWFPEPEKYNPDRFLPDSDHKIRPYTYLPFGVGPRNCVGMKFSQMEMKMCLANVFRHFRFSTIPESKITMDFGSGLGIHRPIEAVVKIEERYDRAGKKKFINGTV